MFFLAAGNWDLKLVTPAMEAGITIDYLELGRFVRDLYIEKSGLK